MSVNVLRGWRASHQPFCLIKGKWKQTDTLRAKIERKIHNGKGKRGKYTIFAACMRRFPY